MLVQATPLSATKDVWRAAEKLLKSYKLFGKGHQNIKGFITEVVAKLTAHFTQFGALEVVLASTEVLVAGEKLLRGEPPEKNFALPLAQAGVVRLRFEPGFDFAQAERFFGALSADAKADAKASEDDLLAALWAEELAQVQLTVIGELDHADPNDVASASWIRAALQILEYGRTLVVQKSPKRPPHLEELAQDGLAELTQVPAPAWDKIALADGARAAMLAELGGGADAARALGYVVEAVASPGEEALDLVAALLGPALAPLVSARAFEDAARLLGAVDAWHLSPVQRERLVPAGAGAMAKDALAALAQGASLPAVLKVLEGLGPAGAPPALDVFAGAAGELKSGLAAVLKTYGDGALAAIDERLLGLEEGPALALVALAGELGGRAAVDVFDSASHHPSPRVAAEGKRRAAPPGTLSPGRAIAELASSRATARSAALDYLVRERMRSSAGAVEAALGTEEFREYDEAEQRRFLETLAALDRERGLAYARKLLAEKSLLGGAKLDQTRAAAASLLGHLKDEASRAQLEELAAGKARPELKKACQDALARIGGAPA